MSIIFTSNRSLQFSSCFSSFSAKSRRQSRFVVGLESTKQNSELQALGLTPNFTKDKRQRVPTLGVVNQMNR